jgi:hypothetical protein
MKHFFCDLCGIEIERTNPRGHPKYCAKHADQVKQLRWKNPGVPTIQLIQEIEIHG